MRNHSAWPLFFAEKPMAGTQDTPRQSASSQEPDEFVFSKRRLEQVKPDSAFWSSEMSSGVTWKPRASMRARVRGKEAGKITVPPSARPLAA